MSSSHSLYTAPRAALDNFFRNNVFVFDVAPGEALELLLQPWPALPATDPTRTHRLQMHGRPQALPWRQKQISHGECQVPCG